MRQISDSNKEYILKRDNYRCRYCGKSSKTFEFDHVYPYSKGGETSLANTVLACKSCNRKKHNKIGVWPKPLGYFGRPKPSYLSFFLAVWSLMLLAFGAFIYFEFPTWGFWSIIGGTIVGFFSIHTKQLLKAK